MKLSVTEKESSRLPPFLVRGRSAPRIPRIDEVSHRPR